MELEKREDTFINFFTYKTWLEGLAYFVDIFEQLNKFNLRLQGPDTIIIQFKDVLSGLVEKIQNWNRKVNQGNFAMLEKLSEFEADSNSKQIKQEISEHLRLLEKQFQRYFPDLDEGFVTFS